MMANHSRLLGEISERPAHSLLSDISPAMLSEFI